MAVDDDDNEVNGNGATSDDDGYVSYYNIVNLIILLICLQFNFYRRRLLPPGEQTPMVTGWRDAGECSRGRGGFPRLVDTMIFTFDVPTQLVKL